MQEVIFIFLIPNITYRLVHGGLPAHNNELMLHKVIRLPGQLMTNPIGTKMNNGTAIMSLRI